MDLIRRKNEYSHSKSHFLIRQLTTLNRLLAKNQISGLLELLQDPVRLMFLNFLAGLARGFGIAIGVTLITGAFLALLTRLASLNLPIIGRFIAELVRIVTEQATNIPH